MNNIILPIDIKYDLIDWQNRDFNTDEYYKSINEKIKTVKISAKVKNNGFNKFVKIYFRPNNRSLNGFIDLYKDIYYKPTGIEIIYLMDWDSMRSTGYKNNRFDVSKNKKYLEIKKNIMDIVNKQKIPIINTDLTKYNLVKYILKNKKNNPDRLIKNLLKLPRDIQNEILSFLYL